MTSTPCCWTRPARSRIGNREAAELIPVGGVDEAGTRRCGAAGEPVRRDSGRSLGRRPGEGAVRAAGAARRASSTHATFVTFTAQTRMSGVDLAETAAVPGRSARVRRRRSSEWVRERGGSRAGGARRDRRRHLQRRRHPARRRRGRSARRPRPRCHPPQGHRQAGHARTLRRDARDGHPHRHDHRRQPADRARRSRTRPGSTTSSPRPRRKTRWR